MPEQSQKSEEEQLLEGLDNDKELVRQRARSKRLTLTIVLMSLVTLAFGSLTYFVMREAQTAMRRAVIAEQNVYNAIREVQRINRRTTAIKEISDVIAFYQPRLTSEYRYELATLVYEFGELKYNIRYEELMILFSLESKWYALAKNPDSGAEGMGQLMYETSRIGATELKIPWDSNVRKNPYYNIKISIWYWNDLRVKFNYTFKWYMCAYGTSGLDKIYEQFTKDVPLSKKQMYYPNEYMKTKLTIETKILHRTIDLE